MVYLTIHQFIYIKIVAQFVNGVDGGIVCVQEPLYFGVGFAVFDGAGGVFRKAQNVGDNNV